MNDRRTELCRALHYYKKTTTYEVAANLAGSSSIPRGAMANYQRQCPFDVIVHAKRRLPTSYGGAACTWVRAAPQPVSQREAERLLNEYWRLPADEQDNWRVGPGAASP